MKAFLIFFAIISISCTFYTADGQFSEDFSDGDLNHSPEWQGDSSAFEIFNGMLHLKAKPETGEAMIATRSDAIDNSIWIFESYLDFDPSSRNYADVYLISDTKNLHAPLNGYFVRIGYTSDNISLYRQNGDRSTAKIIIKGDENRTGPPVRIRLKVTRDPAGNWELFSDPGLTGNYIREGGVCDKTFSGSKYFGIFCRYTSTRADKFFFDNISVTGMPAADQIPPAVDSVTQISGNTLAVHFSEPVLKYPAASPRNYQIGNNNSAWSPAVSVQLNGDIAIVSFEKNFKSGENQQLVVERLADRCLNSAGPEYFDIIARDFTPLRYRGIVINEIMADPYPANGLPPDEYVELFNASDQAVNLANWHLVGAGNEPFPTYIFPPESYVVLAGSTATGPFASPVIPWGNAGNLLNGGEWLLLQDPSGKTIDSLKYDLTWYKDSGKIHGGWSLEQINPFSVCTGPDNWTASADTTGGTPGRKNSVFALSADTRPPVLTGIKTVDSLTVLVTFNEMPLHFADSSFHLQSGSFASRVWAGPEYNQLLVRFPLPFTEAVKNTLVFQDIADCAGNEIEKGTEIFYYDRRPPAIQSVVTLTDNRIKVLFNEKVERKSASRTSGYQINPGNLYPVQVNIAGDSGVYLTFPESLNEGNYTITCREIRDLNGNRMTEETFSFGFRLPIPPGFNEIVISEIMADPTPVRHLPAYEYLELHNISGHEIRLADAVLQLGQKRRTIPEIYMNTGGYLILCPPSAGEFFGREVSTLKVSNWPAIKNHGDTLALYLSDGKLLFAIAYDESWYRSLDKKTGGWSLEMIDVSRGCAGKDNWKASVDPAGGTPGRENSVHWPKPDLKGPELLSAGAPDSLTVLLKFSERLHPENFADMIIFTDPPLDIKTKRLIMPLGNRVCLALDQPLRTGIRYHLRIDNATDCCGNLNGKTGLEASFVLPGNPASGDIIINEILFHPRSGGVEFVELYNRSEKYFNMQKLFIAIKKNGEYIRKKAVSAELHIFNPHEFLVLTKDPSILKGDYPSGNAETFLKMDLPQLNNEEGTIALLRDDGRLIDSVYYNEGFHHPLISNPAGVSLERTSLDKQNENEVMWHSAASRAGYATPGKMNSQYLPGGMPENFIRVEPRVITPGSPGIPDFVTISFAFAHPGMVGTIEVFDVRGHKIKTIANNELLAIGGSYIWRGDDDNGHGVRAGQYILRFELYNPSGQHQLVKKTVAVGRNF